MCGRAWLAPVAPLKALAAHSRGKPHSRYFSMRRAEREATSERLLWKQPVQSPGRAPEVPHGSRPSRGSCLTRLHLSRGQTSSLAPRKGGQGLGRERVREGLRTATPVLGLLGSFRAGSAVKQGLCPGRGSAWPFYHKLVSQAESTCVPSGWVTLQGCRGRETAHPGTWLWRADPTQPGTDPYCGCPGRLHSPREQAPPAAAPQTLGTEESREGRWPTQTTPQLRDALLASERKMGTDAFSPGRLLRLRTVLGS